MNLSLKLLTTYLRPYRTRLLTLTLLLLGGIGLQLGAPQLLRRFLDQAQAGVALRALTTTAVFFFIATLLQKIIALITAYLGEDLGWATTNDLRADLTEHVLRLDMSFHKLRTPGELIERIDGDIENLANYFSMIIIQIFGNGLLAVGVMTLLFLEDWRVGLVGIGYAVLVTLFLRVIQEMAVGMWKDVRQAFATLFGFLEERISGTEDIRANGGTGHVIARLDPLIGSIVAARVRAETFGSVSFIIGFFFYVMSLALTLGISASAYLNGSMTLGTVFLVSVYIQRLETPLNTIRRHVADLQRAVASVRRVAELLAVQPAVQEEITATLKPTAPAITFDNVTFGYHDGQGEDKLVLENIRFRLEAGRVLGILGRTGSGKTTLTRLLFRLYDPDSGTVQLNEQNIRHVALSDLRQQVGMVTQDVQLFAASVRDNLTLFRNYGDGGPISDEQMTAVLHTLGLAEWLNNLPNGLDSQLGGNEAGLSAGQAQLLAFARVFLRNPKLVLLDEASSRLDPATEQLLERAIDALLHRRTGIIIAHRLQTVQRADDILILENGRIVEHGPRETLANNPTSRFAALLRTGLEEHLA